MRLALSRVTVTFYIVHIIKRKTRHGKEKKSCIDKSSTEKCVCVMHADTRYPSCFFRSLIYLPFTIYLFIYLFSYLFPLRSAFVPESLGGKQNGNEGGVLFASV